MLEDPDGLELDAVERVMSRDEHDRRRETEKAVFQTTLLEGKPTATITPPVAGHQALVTAVAGLHARIKIGKREFKSTIRGILTEIETGFVNPVAIGDRVIVSQDGANGWVIENILPRQTILARPDPLLAPRQQVIAANIDLLLIVVALRDPVIWLELIDRYLIVAKRSGIEPIICINKMDLVSDERDLETIMNTYCNLSQRILPTSVPNSLGVDALRETLRNHTTVVAGPSGTGKSSLISAVQPSLKLRTGQVSETNRQGQHTTTQSILLDLDVGGYVADTPGIREFGLSGLTRVELQDYFPEILTHASNCKFNNCSHIVEPGCAVQSAENSGTIAKSRAHSYRLIWNQLSN